jgi:hypothetical protein
MSCFLYTNDEESVRKVNIDDLYENKQRRNLKQLSIFNKILNRVQKRIQMTAKNRSTDQFIWFLVPEYIFGESIYDKGDCIAYLVLKLEENGFLVKYIHPNTLFVSWSNWIPAYVRTEFKKKTGKTIDEKGNILDKKEDDADTETVLNTDINSRIMNGNGNTTVQKDVKQFTPINKYKPTGQFVYNPDILEKIEKKVSFT